MKQPDTWQYYDSNRYLESLWLPWHSRVIGHWQLHALETNLVEPKNGGESAKGGEKLAELNGLQAVKLKILKCGVVG